MKPSRYILLIPFIWLLVAAITAYLLFSWDTPSIEQRSLHGNFLHITDIHPDVYFRTNATARSSCHKFAVEATKKPKHMKRGTAGPWGAPATICDSPMVLVDATFDWLKQYWKGELDFIIWTGDNARHDNDDMIPRKEKEILHSNRLITDKFINTFAHHKHGGKPDSSKMIPIIPCIGNNDVYPANVIPAGPNFMLDSLADIWAPFIPRMQMRFFRRGGYFVKEVIPNKLVVVSLNTLYFFKANSAVHGCKAENEPGRDHLVWLDQVLRRTRKRGMKAYLVGHIAPRRKHYTPSCYKRYVKIAHKYHDIILGHFFGHSNMDHFFFISPNKKRRKTMEHEDTVENYVEDIMGDDDTDSDITENTTEDFDPSSNPKQNASLSTLTDNVSTTVYNLNRYIHRLLRHYRTVPSIRRVGSEYAVVHINPSIIPTFFPALRIFQYNTTDVTRKDHGVTEKEVIDFHTDMYKPAADNDVFNNEDGSSDADNWDEEDELSDQSNISPTPISSSSSSSSLANSTRARSHDPNSPVHTNTFLTPLGYIQYFVNLTEANKYPHVRPRYEIEYTTKGDYDMNDLTVDSWMQLARRIARDGLKSRLGRKVLDHLLVGSRSVVRARAALGNMFVEGNAGVKGPADYLREDLWF